jgi:hypothetical protein
MLASNWGVWSPTKIVAKSPMHPESLFLNPKKAANQPMALQQDHSVNNEDN